MAKRKTLAEIDAAISRWTTKLTRASNTLARLRLQRMRAKQREEKPKPSIPTMPMPAKRPRGHADLNNFVETFGPAIRESAEDAGLIPVKTEIDTSVPDFLKRDKNAAEEIKAEQAEIKKKKTAGRIAKMKAAKSGETKKMPLSGKAALAAIRGD